MVWRKINICGEKVKNAGEKEKKSFRKRELRLEGGRGAEGFAANFRITGRQGLGEFACRNHGVQVRCPFSHLLRKLLFFPGSDSNLISRKSCTNLWHFFRSLPEHVCLQINVPL
jgi:hypothetical protein